VVLQPLLGVLLIGVLLIGVATTACDRRVTPAKRAAPDRSTAPPQLGHGEPEAAHHQQDDVTHHARRYRPGDRRRTAWRVATGSEPSSCS
jgi:hypothetical protein